MHPKVKNEIEPLAFTVDEVARKLGLPKSSAYAAISRGDIPSIRIGSLIRVPRDAITEMLKLPTKQAS